MNNDINLNKKIIAAFFGIVLLSPVPALADLNTGLVAYYPFNGNANDMSGNNNHGVLHGGVALTADHNGKANGAYSFNGINGYISASGNNLPTTTRTIVVLFKANTLTIRPALLGYGGGSTCGTSLFMGVNIGHHDSSYLISSHCEVNNLFKQYTPADVIGKWIQFAFSTDSTGTAMYINGIKVASNSNFINNTVVQGTDLAMGVIVSPGGIAPYTDGNVGYLNGAIDDVRIYNRALNATEIWQLYNQEFPQQIHATPLSPSVMRLSWKDNARNEKAFRIQRKIGNCNSTNTWTTLLDVPANGIAAWDVPVTPNTSYAYQIARYYGDQTFSPYSTCVSATSAVAGTPMMPNNMTEMANIATSQSSSQVNLSWNDASNNETRFDIYRKAGSGNWALLKSVAANSQSYSDTTASGNMNTTSYSYAIGVCNAAGCSQVFQNPFVVPFSPTNLAVTAGTTTKLTWKDNSNNETGFQLQRKNGTCASVNPWGVMTNAISANAQSFSDSSAVSGESYSYKVRSYSKTAAQPYGFGYSGFSNCVSVTAP